MHHVQKFSNENPQRELFKKTAAFDLEGELRKGGFHFQKWNYARKIGEREKQKEKIKWAKREEEEEGERKRKCGEREIKEEREK